MKCLSWSNEISAIVCTLGIMPTICDNARCLEFYSAVCIIVLLSWSETLEAEGHEYADFSLESANCSLNASHERNTQTFEDCFSRDDLNCAKFCAFISVQHRQGTMPMVFRLGQMLVSRRLYSEAIELYEKALEVATGDSNLYFHLGSAYASDNRWPAAAEAFLAAVDSHPLHADAWLLRAVALLNLHHTHPGYEGEAHRCLATVLRLFQSERLLLHAAAALAAAGPPSQRTALHLLRRAARQWPSSAAAHPPLICAATSRCPTIWR